MAETSYPSAGGGAVTDANYELLMGGATGDGLIGSPAFSALAYGDSSGRQVKIRGSRAAIVRGFRWQTDSAGLTLPVAANSSGQPRKDLVVLRLDRNTYNVRATILTGTAGASPAAPSPVVADPPSQYFDLPLATVTVPSAAAPGPVLGAGDVVESTWYLAEPMIVGKSTYMPTSVPGRLIWQYDVNNLWVGNAGGSYDNVQRDSGWINQTLTAGWTAIDNIGVKVRRKADIIFLTMRLRRTGGAVASGTDSTLTTLTNVHFRPETIHADGVFHCGNPDHSSDFWVSKDTGQVILNANGTHAINDESMVWGSTSWPVSG